MIYVTLYLAHDSGASTPIVYGELPDSFVPAVGESVEFPVSDVVPLSHREHLASRAWVVEHRAWTCHRFADGSSMVALALILRDAEAG